MRRALLALGFVAAAAAAGATAAVVVEDGDGAAPLLMMPMAHTMSMPMAEHAPMTACMACMDGMPRRGADAMPADRPEPCEDMWSAHHGPQQRDR